MVERERAQTLDVRAGTVRVGDYLTIGGQSRRVAQIRTVSHGARLELDDGLRLALPTGVSLTVTRPYARLPWQRRWTG